MHRPAVGGLAGRRTLAVLAVMAAALALFLASPARAASPPTVTAVSPTGGPIAGGTLVTVTGTDFTGATDVKFGTLSGTDVTVVDATHITVKSPAQAAGTVHVTVTTPDGTSATGTADQFAYFDMPTITGVSPAAGPLAGGTVVTITGTALAGTTAVAFGGVAATGVTPISDTQLTAVAPAHSAAAVDVTVTTPGGTSATSSADLFTYTAAPVVTGINPPTGPVGGATVVTITGTGFTGVTGVAFGGTAATNVTLVSDTSVLATAPAHAAGPVDVVVTTPGGASATSTADVFTYTGGPAVTAVSPKGGPVAGGTLVTVTGSGFTGATSVTFGGTAGTGLTVVSDTSITVTSPAHAGGTVDVLVITPGGSSAVTTSDQFTYGPAPTVTGVSPTTGVAGTVVTITGTGFTGATSVTFGGTAATPTSASATTITVAAPAHAPGTVDVVVIAPTGSSATAAVARFTYTGGTITFTLNFRWSLIVWQGQDGISIAVALKGQETPDNSATNDVSSQVTAIFRWNASAQKWEGYFPGSESVPGANDFTTFSKGTAYWIATVGPGSVSWTVIQG